MEKIATYQGCTCDFFTSRPFSALTAHEITRKRRLADLSLLSLSLSSEFNIIDLVGTVPPAIGGLQWLEVFSITNGCVTDALPKEIGLLSNLEEILLSDASNATLCSTIARNVTNLPNEMASLVKLESLTISMASLNSTLPFDIGNMTSLEHLRISMPVALPDGVGLHGMIPLSLYDLDGLKTLSLVQTSLMSFWTPPSNPLPSLEELNLSHSTTFFGGVGFLPKLANLRKVDYSYSTFRDRVDITTELPLLTHINFDNSGITWNVTKSFWENHPHMVSISAQSIAELTGEIDASIGAMKRLRHLNLENSGARGTIPSSICDCPLKILNLRKTQITLPIPENIGQLNETLVELYLSDLTGAVSTIPDSIGSLKLLEKIDLSTSGLNGTIPPSMSKLNRLDMLFLYSNDLNGTIPDIQGRSTLIIELHGNRLSGTIPASIAASSRFIYLSRNDLSGLIPQDLFVSNRELVSVDLARNRFSGPLPLFNTVFPPEAIDLDNNQFDGTVPASYSVSSAILLSHNKLSGSLDPLLTGNASNLVSVVLSGNQFGGTLPSLTSHVKLRLFDARNNNLTGAFPEFNQDLQALGLSDNHFDAGNIGPWADSVRASGLRYLDLSSNDFFSYIPYTQLIGPSLTYLSVSNNRFVTRSVDPLSPSTAITGLDISSTGQTGAFPAFLFPNVILLKMANNLFTGSMDIQRLQSLTQLDMSNNYFRFDIGRFSGLPLLTNIEARTNLLFGSLSLDNLPNLQTADFSSNHLRYPPDLITIGELFKGRLQLLNISNNPEITPIKNLDTKKTGLARSALSSPSAEFSNTVNCFELSFYNQSGHTFLYDEKLFDYLQCDCNGDHFGVPPLKCLTCPTDDSVSCGGRDMNVSKNSYVMLKISDGHIPAPGASRVDSFSSENGLTLTLLQALHSSLSGLLSLDSTLQDDESTNEENFKFETESCLITTVQTLEGRSNCQGVNITAGDLGNGPVSQVSLENLLKPQCAEGSDGRLCSRCMCDTEKEEKCWFSRGAGCSKCRRVFKPSASFPLAAGVLLALIISLSLVMAALLRRRRKQSLRKLSELGVLRRIFYRLQYLTSMGNLSILITFLQTLIAFTQWDAYMRVEIFGVLNGSGEGLGLVCLFPFLSEPMWALIAQLSIPFIAVGVLALSVGIGSLILKCLDARQRKKTDVRDALQVGENETEILIKKDLEISIDYSASALLTSLAIKIVKFLYFGTALAAHQYLFSSVQLATGAKYVQSKPYMSYSDAWPLILASIPAIIIFDFCIPAVFMVISWRVRNRFKQRSVQIYFGSLFETYNPNCFWWEIVNTLKKLSIALALKALPSANAAQSAIVVSILAGTLLIQVTLAPWRRKSENLADSASSLILIAALVYTRPVQFLYASGVLWYIFALSAVFVLASVGILGYETATGITDYDRQLERHLETVGFSTQDQSKMILFADEGSMSSEGDAQSVDTQ